MIFDHQNLGIDTSYVQLSVIFDQDMIQNIIFGNGGTFCPSLPFLDNLTPPPDFCKDAYLRFGTKKPNYEWSSTRFYVKPFMENIPQTNVSRSNA